ncbi:MAG TPA: HAD family hydrolase [Thermomicrobiales bacterium]|nr:HAD family hydrolase [Thermomicrobiales bacterium]
MNARALFLDRDGTLVEPRHYPRGPEELILYPGVGAALRPFQATGFRLVVVTNQSGIAHGYFDDIALARMHDHLAAELGRDGVRLDGIYHCPHHPEGVVPELAVRCDCRKPSPGLVKRAAADLAVDPARSWFVGDILDDIEAGNRAGCRTVLVDLGTESPPPTPVRQPDHVARDTVHALAIIARVEGLGDEADLDYRPASWGEPVLTGQTQ